jgi:hypothetical protein
VSRVGIRPGVDGNGPDPAAAQRIDAHVVGDAENPRRQASRRIEGGQVAEGLDECVLGKVFRQRSVAGQPEEQRYDRTLVPAHDLLERCLGAAERLRDQPRFLDAIDVDSDERSLA